MNNYLKLSVGCAQKSGIITDVIKRSPTGREKIYLKVSTTDKFEYTVNEVWKTNRDEKLTTEGLWIEHDINGQISDFSNLGRLLATLGGSKIEDLIGKQVKLSPKPNGFMCIQLQ